MKCTSCNTHVTKIPLNWKCPHCGERLPELSRWEIFSEAVVDTLKDKGVLFWSISLGLILIALGFVELFFDHAYLLGYLGSNPLLGIGGFFFGGMLLDMVMKINLPLRLPYGTDFLINERKQIRNIRKATNGALFIGIVYALIYVSPTGFLLHFNAYLLIIAWWLSMAWSITGLFIDPRLVEDIRIRYFLDDRLGITSLKRYRRLGTVLIGLLIVIAVVFYFLMGTSTLWLKFSNMPVVGNIISFSKAYLGWLF